MLRLLSFQPVSLYQNGGASRVLRRLYDGREAQVISIGVKENNNYILAGPMAETIVTAYPVQRSWMRWKVRNLFIWLREKAMAGYTRNRIRQIASQNKFDAVHVICHGSYVMAVYDKQLLNGKQLWVSFHDHFAAAGTGFDNTKTLWTNANRRLVISAQMGLEYQRLFGSMPYEIITDGLLPGELSDVKEIDPLTPLTIYFSGLLHNEYHPLFMVLAQALDVLAGRGITVKLIMRGTQKVSFLNERAFATEYRNDFISDEAIKKEMDAASILYLPIKYNDPDFYLYSLSTKMVGYLGAPGSMLYHGPADSAACLMLKEAGAAVDCTSLDAVDMLACLDELMSNKRKVSVRAKLLAKEKFNMLVIKKQFWQD
ncbi:hypothetical protein [Mucilaginibacter sp.]|uniref:hypothetical protein n=1 Tax=Mucilaginibacter sp. TaxID=1882438 RepID=UPI0035BC252E